MLCAPIGIGGSGAPLFPCHTTGHAGPHPAVRKVEVGRLSEAFPSAPCPESPIAPVADSAAPLREASGLHPCAPARVPRGQMSGTWHRRDPWSFRSPFRSALHQLGFQGPAPSGWLLRPRLTSRSASQRCPFRHQARPPQVRLRDLSRTTAGSTQWLFGRYGFAVCGPLALIHHALYPVPVRRLASLPHASSGPHLAVTPLRFASARCDLLAQRTFTSKSRAMLGAPK